MPIDYRYAEKVPGPLYTIRERDLTHIKPQILGVGEVLYCYGKKMICVRQAIYRVFMGKKSSSCFHVAPIFLNYHISIRFLFKFWKLIILFLKEFP